MTETDNHIGQICIQGVSGDLKMYFIGRFEDDVLGSSVFFLKKL